MCKSVMPLINKHTHVLSCRLSDDGEEEDLAADSSEPPAQKAKTQQVRACILFCSSFFMSMCGHLFPYTCSQLCDA